AGTGAPMRWRSAARSVTGRPFTLAAARGVKLRSTWRTAGRAPDVSITRRSGPSSRTRAAAEGSRSLEARAAASFPETTTSVFGSKSSRSKTATVSLTEPAGTTRLERLTPGRGAVSFQSVTGTPTDASTRTGARPGVSAGTSDAITDVTAAARSHFTRRSQLLWR